MAMSNDTGKRDYGGTGNPGVQRSEMASWPYGSTYRRMEGPVGFEPVDSRIKRSRQLVPACPATPTKSWW